MTCCKAIVTFEIGNRLVSMACEYLSLVAG